MSTKYKPPSSPDRNAPRFTQVPTLLRAPLADSLDDVDIGLVGVPYDGALTNRPGARHGPREVRNESSLMRMINHVSRQNPFELCRIADVGDVPFSEVLVIEAAMKEIESFFADLCAANVIPVAVGGDHSISLPILRSLAKSGPVAMIHFDAHTDTWADFQGSKFHHGSPFRWAVEENLIDPKKTIQIGIRGAQNITDGWDFSVKSGMRVVFIEELFERGTKEIVKEARKIVGDSPVYLTFDVDGLDPVYAPGTGTPEIGGFTTAQALDMLKGLRGLNYVGGDVVEISPPFDVGGLTSLAGATILYEIVCLIAENFA
jgi:guanidinopropionase